MTTTKNKDELANLIKYINSREICFEKIISMLECAKQIYIIDVMQKEVEK